MEKVMNKTQLVDVVAKAAGMKKKEAEVAVEAVFDAIADALADGDKVQIIGFGTFEAKGQAEREGRNPMTGEKITIPACKRPAFAASQALKDKINA